MSDPVDIKSPSEWQSLLSGTSVVVTDFYADWCGPCKMIAPHFQRLANQHSVPKKIAFAKVNVDSQQQIAQQNAVSAMPTFKIFHNGSCIQTIQGANPASLSDAVAKAVQLAGASKSAEALFKSPGRTLGGPPVHAAYARREFDLGGLLNMFISFVGLYIVSLFSKAAEQSRFNIHNSGKEKSKPSRGSSSASGSGPSYASRTSGSGTAARPPQQRAAFKTLADL
ncbi:uncharacterized protein UV8b_02307 [Ustilaginoidea virens]|uniref:Thioredoxin domain-containing protein n=1 Tax=Ustilaginoidea virens TaxID=1159556 RepID=A0A8E5MG02_USTVR|nr:uncharacterized protein UV8b_02307 [Ustilaginoidea virens]QUC18066.1 hypothetical protein UV8b_02307 [Ustilaginoidea virens]